jgi:hypothetical protein
MLAGAPGRPFAAEIRLRLPMATPARDTTVLVSASMAMEPGDVMKNPTARAAAGTVVLIPWQSPQRVVFQRTRPIDGNRTLSRLCKEAVPFPVRNRCSFGTRSLRSTIGRSNPEQWIRQSQRPPKSVPRFSQLSVTVRQPVLQCRQQANQRLAPVTDQSWRKLGVTGARKVQ